MFKSYRYIFSTVLRHEYLSSRAISTTSKISVKEIIEKNQGNVKIIEGVISESGRKATVLPTTHKGACPVCSLNLPIKYTDVLILSQFLRPDGCLLPRRVTNVCGNQQKKLSVLVRQAQNAGLLSPFRPDRKNGKERTSHRSNYKWKKYNLYFEDD